MISFNKKKNLEFQRFVYNEPFGISEIAREVPFNIHIEEKFQYFSEGCTAFF